MRHSAEGETPSDQVPENMPANMPAEIVRKVAEALEVALDAAYDSSIYRWPQQEDIPPIAAAVLAVAEPLIREQVAQEIEASTVLERAAKIARGGQ